MKVVLANQAKTDLREIGDFIAGDSPAAAERTVRKLIGAAKDLAKSPAKFPIVGSLRGRQLRRRPSGNYAIYYVVGERYVEVARILHSARNADAILFPED